MTPDELTLAYEETFAVEVEAADPDEGTTLRHPTLRKGVVTATSPLRVATGGGSVGHPARNVGGRTLSVGSVVWLLVDGGRRLVIDGPRETAAYGLTSATLRRVATQSTGGGSWQDVPWNTTDSDSAPPGWGYAYATGYSVGAPGRYLVHGQCRLSNALAGHQTARVSRNGVGDDRWPRGSLDTTSGVGRWLQFSGVVPVTAAGQSLSMQVFLQSAGSYEQAILDVTYLGP